ncbi:hypothetical protein XELAEV_18027365mg [Xenopus laevis]|uniref:Uncharacterized protein n=1 Tax=Xenopus laevis TaxID=8355 RepID=A0A974HJQ3_XENLA|nr:hypothetical protein XELAEV_18027365mg [Xenopus laevis]
MRNIINIYKNYLNILNSLNLTSNGPNGKHQNVDLLLGCTIDFCHFDFGQILHAFFKSQYTIALITASAGNVSFKFLSIK